MSLLPDPDLEDYFALPKAPSPSLDPPRPPLPEHFVMPPLPELWLGDATQPSSPENDLRLQYLQQLRRAYQTRDFSPLFGAIDEECVWGGSALRDGIRGKDAVIEHLKRMARRRACPMSAIVRARSPHRLPNPQLPRPYAMDYYLHFCIFSQPGDYGMLEVWSDPGGRIKAAFWRMGISPQGKILSYVDDTPMGQWH